MSHLTRRGFVRLSLLGAAGLVCGGCTRGPTAPQARPEGPRLGARPGAPTQPVAAGSHSLKADVGRDCTLHVPAGYSVTAGAPLLVMFHGAGASRDIMDQLAPFAAKHGVVLLLLYSQGRTWDMVLGAFGPDVEALDRALTAAFDRVRVPADSVFIGGFSDGGSYALSLGLANGDLFSHVAAFSPGFVYAPETVGKPGIFMAHGTQDTVLPIDSTSRPISQGLIADGYRVEYVEFQGPHTLSVPMFERALDWMQQGSQ